MKEKQERFVSGAILFSVLVGLLVTAAQSFGREADKILEGPLAPGVASVAELQGPGGATDLMAEVECSDTTPRKGIAKLSWNVGRPGSEQRVAITIFRDGFEKGTFESTEPLPPQQSSVTWDRLKGQAIHFWTVLTLQGNQWVASEIATFEGPTCVSDIVPP